MKSSKLMILVICLTVLVSMLNASTWDVSVDFSETTNPTGAWTYGLGVLPETVPGDFWAIGQSENNYRSNGVFAWADSGLGAAVLKNNSGSTVLGMETGQVGIQGSIHRNAAVRWTSPVTDKVYITGGFGQTPAGENCSQWIVHNDTNILVTRLRTSSDYEFGFYLNVNTGDTVDFVAATATLGDQTVVPFSCKIYSSDETISTSLEWDLSDSFTINSNPNSPWTYGLGTLPWTAGDFWPVGTSQTDYLSNGIDGWIDAGMGVALFKNTTTGTLQGVAPRQVAMHGSVHRNAAVRWTSPVNDRIQIVGKFGQMTSGEDATEYIVHNDNNVVFGKLFTTTENSFNVYIDVKAGDTIDFVVATANEGTNTIVPIDCKILNSVANSDFSLEKWDLSTSFAKELNPADDWLYGSQLISNLDPNKFEAYVDFTDPYNGQTGLTAWYSTSGDAVVMNKSTSVVSNLESGQVGLYPTAASHAAVTWVAPNQGTVNVDAVFGGGDSSVNANLWVLFNGVLVDSRTDFEGEFVVNRILNVYAGDTISFVAGVANQGSSIVPFDCQITATPGFGLGMNQAWDAAKDFTEAANPNGAWTSGIGWLPYDPWKGDFWNFWNMISDETDGRFADGIIGWWDLYGDGVTYLGSIQKNDSTATANGIKSGALALEPTAYRQVAMRWTAPADGAYAMSGYFGIIGSGNDGSYYIVKNDNINYMWQERTQDKEFFSFIADAKAGDTFDFIGAIGNPGDTNLIELDCRVFAQETAGAGSNSWDANEDFSIALNPNGQWSYGYGLIEDAGKDVFIAYEQSYTDPNNFEELVNGTYQWRDKTTDCILYNSTASSLEYLRPDQIGLVASWEFSSALRWTSPGDGLVYVESVFGNGNPQAEASYAVIVNRSKVLSKSYTANDPLVQNCLTEDKALGFAIEVEEGDTIDFVGGYGRIVTDSIVPVDIRITPAAGFKDYSLNPRATAPSPADDAAGSSLNPVMTWQSGRSGAVNYVYFGTDASSVTSSGLLAQDIDMSGIVDLGDLLLFAGEWLTLGVVADFDANGSVDYDDFASLAYEWGFATPSLAQVTTVNEFVPNDLLTQGDTYYWRVDEYKDGVMTKGKVWSFTAGLAEDKNAVLSNPDMGWQLQESYVVDSHINGSSNILTYPDEVFDGIDNVMLLFAWSDIETSQGVYDFTKVNYAYDYWKSKGKNIHLRMSTESLLWWNNVNPAAGEGVPGYIVSALGSSDVQVRQNEGINYVVVNANNSFYQSRLQAFLQAAASNFDASRPVDYIDLAGFGLWGEWHSGYQYANLSARRQALISIIDAWCAAFPDTYLSLSYSYDPDSPGEYHDGPVTHYDSAYTAYYNDFVNYSAFDYALAKLNVTFRRNGCGEAVVSNERKFADETFALLNHGPLGVEMAGTYMKYRRGQSNDFDVDAAIADLLSLHANYSTIIGWDSWRAKSFIDSRPDLFNYVSNNLGYRFVPKSVDVPYQVSGGFDVGFVWNNIAGGKAVQDYEITLEFRDLQKNPVAEVSGGQIATSIWINGVDYPVSLTVPAGVLSSGTYEVYVKLIDSRTSEMIELPLHDGIDQAYPVGIVNVN